MSEKEGGEQGACGFSGEPVAASEEYISGESQPARAGCPVC